MPNNSASDNILTPRTVVAPSTAAHWSGADLQVPDSTRYVRGTVELLNGGSTISPSVGTIESCEFDEIGSEEELSDGASGVEAYDFYELGYKVSVTARFRKTDDPPKKGEIFALNMPEGGQSDSLPLRFVCTESGASWSERGIRKCKFSGKMHVSMLNATLSTAKLSGVGVTVDSTTQNSEVPAPGFGDLDGVQASGLLTSTGVNVSDADTVTIGSTVYRFKDTMAQAYDVRRGADAASSLANLKHAINGTGVAGANYYTGTLVHPTVTAGTITSTTLALTANATGSGGNSIATTETAATLSFGSATLTGGA